MKVLEKVFAGTAIVSSLLFGGVSKLTMAEVIAASSKPGVVRIYNPQEFTQTGTLTTADGTTPISLPAHNVQAYDVPAGTVVVTPDGDAPDFIVDYETEDFASPVIAKEFSGTRFSGNGDGKLYLLSKDGGTAVVTQFVAGKPASAVTVAVPAHGATSVGVIGEYSVDFISGSGAAAFEGAGSEQRSLTGTESLLSTTGLWWGKTASSTVLKPTFEEVKGMNADGEFAYFIAKDAQFLAKFGTPTEIKRVFSVLTNGDKSDGELATTPLKVIGDTLYLFLDGSGYVDVDGLTSKKLANGNYKVTVNAPSARATILAMLGGEVERHPTRYYQNVNIATRPNATWAKQKMNKSITAAAPLLTDEAQLVPYVTPDTTITLTNSSPWTTTYTVSTAPMGSDPRTGAPQSFTLAPGQTQTLENLVTQEGSAYIKTNGSKPVVSAERPGLDIPVVDEEYANNRNKQAVVMQTGKEKVVFLSGDSTSTNTMTFEARGPEGAGYVSSKPLYGPPNIVTSGYINDILNMVNAPNSSCTLIPKFEDESKASMLFLYENPATLDQRIQKGQEVVKATLSPADFVAANLPIDHFFLDNWELRSLIRGDAGTRSYAYDMAKILYDHSTPQLPGDVAMLEQALHYEVDGDYSNGEVCHTKDPLACVNSSVAHAVILYESTENCSKVTNFNMDPAGSQEFYNLMKTDALPSLVQANPDHYGYPDNSYTSWGTQDPN